MVWSLETVSSLAMALSQAILLSTAQSAMLDGDGSSVILVALDDGIDCLDY